MQLCLTLCDPMDYRPPGSRPWDFPAKNSGVSCPALLQGILLTHGSNLHLLTSLVLADGFFTSNTTWEALETDKELQKICKKVPRAHHPASPNDDTENKNSLSAQKIDRHSKVNQLPALIQFSPVFACTQILCLFVY